MELFILELKPNSLVLQDTANYHWAAANHLKIQTIIFKLHPNNSAAATAANYLYAAESYSEAADIF